MRKHRPQQRRKVSSLSRPVDSGIAGAHDAVLTGEACMGEGATFIRREGVKQECIALQMEGDDEARLLLYAQGLVNQAIADLLEDPEQMRKLLEIARFKPTLRLVHNRDSEHG